MAVNKLKAPRNIHIDFSPSPRQYELWKLLQPNYCPHCGAEIEQVLVGYDQQRNPQYKVTIRYSTSCGIYLGALPLWRKVNKYSIISYENTPKE